MKRFLLVTFAILSVLLAGCPGPMSPPGEGGGGAGGSAPVYTGPSATPYCGSTTYDDACRAAVPDGIPYCYAPAHQGDVGPAPFPSCVIVLGGNAPPVTRAGEWASWWCCPFHNEGDGGVVTLDGGGIGQ